MRNGAAAGIGERVVCRTLAEYLVALVDRLRVDEPAAFGRLREVAGARVARIALDDETVDVRFEGERLLVLEAAPASTPTDPVDGEGWADRLTTLRLLDGSLEVTEAILQGRIDARGDNDSLARIFQAIEILLDASARLPALARLASAYEADPCRRSRPPDREPPGGATAVARAAERALLLRLDLLP